MSWMSLLMDGVLAVLLLAALAFGARLHKQLKILRSGQEAFAQAVADLDRAAITAHNSLKELRKDADESQDLLHGRIIAGREVMQKLETQLARAERQLKDIETATVAARIAAASSQAIVRPQIEAPREAARETSRETPRETPLTLRTARPAAQPEVDENYNPAWAAPKKTAAVRASDKPAARAPFDRDVVPSTAAAPADRRKPEPRPATNAKGGNEAEMLEKVQMSELVVANLNEMIRSLTLPKRRAMSLEQDLFGEED